MSVPLAERLRPETLTEVAGQQHLVGPLGVLTKLVATGSVPSLIFWGPPGVGKTTVARLVAAATGTEFRQLSAVEAGVAEVRAVIELAENLRRLGQQLTLFLDEIHRFNKAQQDRLLRAVEDGTLTLIGATTENPSFEVIAPLLSRARVLEFRPLSTTDLQQLLTRALADPRGLAGRWSLAAEAAQILLATCGGDARALLTTLELAAELAGRGEISVETAQQAAGASTRRYDKTGEEHFNHASALIKSLRGSDADAALYYLARMLMGGEDPKFIARRLVIFASEDIGNAAPNALVLATACFTAVQQIGLPECGLNLAQTVIYLARAPKSRASNDALKAALAAAEATKAVAIPLHLRNPVTKEMRAAGYGARYCMPHEKGFEQQKYLPPEIAGQQFFWPSGAGLEK